MAKIIRYCPVCQKQADLVSESEFMGLKQFRYACGHIQCKALVSSKDFSDFISDDNQKPFKFQIEGAVFGLNSDVRCGILDDMGCGKTIQAIMIASKLRQSNPKIKTCVICKKRLMIQFFREFARWTKDEFIMQILENENDFIISKSPGIIISYDMLWRFKNIPDFVSRAKLGNGLLILDEVQHIKNSNTKRTQGVRELSRHIEHVIALSGTPIKNHAGEFFPVLNILRPDRYHNQAQFEAIECVTYQSGWGHKVGGLKDSAHFWEKNKDFLIRRTKEQVLPDLPKILRENMFCELGAEVEKEYIEEMKRFQQFALYDSQDLTAFQRQTELLGYLGRMRRLTGKAKVAAVVEYLQDFLESYDSKKIVVFLHHHEVAGKIIDALSLASLGQACVNLTAQSDQSVIDEFKNNPCVRIMFASTLSAGEGLNLQFCDTCIIMERQWNPANEEQAEGRFPRPGQTSDKITSVYFTAIGTIDEFLAEIVEKKRSISANVLDAKEIAWDESSIIKELAEVLAINGGKRWGF
jgi:SWI/SNF-related matrix-associated actin-dependent regulator 1 of chromatin subfamily A